MRKVRAFTLAPVLTLLAVLVLAHVVAFGVGYAWGRTHMALEILSYDD